MRNQRLYIIALDGVPFTLLRSFFNAGIMPGLKALSEVSVMRPMKSVLPPLSAPAWASFLTGKPPYAHGILSFTERDPHTLHWYTPNARHLKAPTLQEKVSESHLRVFSMNFPVTYPPRPVNGVSICGFLGNDLESGVYPEKEAFILKKRGYRIDSDVHLARANLKAFIDDLFHVLQKRTENALYYHKREPWDLFMVHIMETDRLHHFTYEAFTEGNPEIRDIYHTLYGKIDRFLVKLMETAPPDSRFILLSDHGFVPLKREIYLNRWLWQKGLLHYTHPRPEKLGHIHPRSVAYSLYPGRIYLNLQGREANGSVSPGEYEQTRNSIREMLSALRDPADGTPVMETVFNGEDIYTPPGMSRLHDPVLSPYPDLLAVAREGYDLKGILWHVTESAKGIYTGMHSVDNAFWLAPALPGAEDVDTIIDAGAFTENALSEMF